MPRQAPKRPVSEFDATERRIRAAMTLAGLDWQTLADRIGTRSLGATTLRKLNATTNQPTALHLRAIAEACGLPYEFFSVDFQRLPELADDQSGPELSLEERLAALEGLVGRLVAAASEPSSATTVSDPPAQGGRLR